MKKDRSNPEAEKPKTRGLRFNIYDEIAEQARKESLVLGEPRVSVVRYLERCHYEHMTRVTRGRKVRSGRTTSESPKTRRRSGTV